MNDDQPEIFEIMKKYDERIGLLAIEADRYLESDHAIAAIKFRVFGELLVAEIGRIKSKHRRGGEDSDRYINRLASSRFISEKAVKDFHEIRKIGNSAAHGEELTYGDALEASKSARAVSIWFLSRYSKRLVEGFNPQESKPVAATEPAPSPQTAGKRRAPSRAEILAASLRGKTRSG